ncbi:MULTISPECIES: MarR family winged helix-turn-helix transcriptional regulator [Ralstonia]|uniref:HTH marR-type domain-containing protein n=1 Tax=Ralstonia thomasii TaxID=3058596 RepID=A0AAD2BQS7_9RALS|nr:MULTISPECIES: MarR family winged helix-turn-helix transcriptional regulator [Ralstonia]MBB0022488.1 MarR family transcriptional regulator [Ralstonia pickettii]MBB0032812.1 MarR family transcriptional regulator [Ralstonia pickettii]MBB0095716.1 MarR family transcriptional regulator [Ralstonia pickettii]MBB0105280.1 MarR family transcriptional regulator [Ralstonia pickettii]MBB0127157.1 MarR family transcriptional regulator [Ralstonia pickettii]
MNDVLALDQQLCFPLYAAGHLLTRLYRPLLDELGLTYPQYLVMLACWQQAPCAVGDLGRTLYLDTGTLTPLLKRLEEQGLVTRTRDPDDQRRVVIELTNAGRALRERAAKVPEALACKIPLELDEIGATRDVLRKLLDALATADDRE